MAQQLVLRPTAHVIDTAVRSRYDVEGVRHLAGVIEVRVQPCAVALVQIAGDGHDAGEEGLVSRESHRETSMARFPSIMSISTRRSRSTSPVTYIAQCSALALKNAVSSMPSELTTSTRHVSSTNGVP